MTTTETKTGLTEEIIGGIARALDLFQGRIDEAILKGADEHWLYNSPDSGIRDIRAAQRWLAETSHQIHLEHVAEEETE